MDNLDQKRSSASLSSAQKNSGGSADVEWNGEPRA